MGFGGGARYGVTGDSDRERNLNRRYVAAVGRAGSSQVPILMKQRLEHLAGGSQRTGHE